MYTENYKSNILVLTIQLSPKHHCINLLFYCTLRTLTNSHTFIHTDIHLHIYTHTLTYTMMWVFSDVRTISPTKKIFFLSTLTLTFTVVFTQSSNSMFVFSSFYHEEKNFVAFSFLSFLCWQC